MDLNTISEVVTARDAPDLTARDAPDLSMWRLGDAWLGGGTWLFSEPQPHLRRLIDLPSLGWPALTVTDEGLEIAATCTLAELHAFAAPAGWPAAQLFARACRALLGSFKIWNAATVGGNLCLALPAGPMISLTAALDGVCEIWGATGPRTLGVRDFVTGPQRNALHPGELLRSVRLPAAALRTPAAFRQVSLSPVGRSAALLIGRRTAGLELTVTASVVRPLRLSFATPPAVAELRDAVAAIPADTYHDDVHGSPAWRRHMTFELAEEIRHELFD
ncbi:CO/xanthine dehydrogenase FAD-binding subunit [Catenuloplanes nepalensis]|uniref:CO/xanthine dehydrogenase FAD-binding subunit n=1 Tax=Catenuloplanes nepalensis TaxID=587533 RepID=A0ABT9N879_9ACTN|nr:FAD binding domain-containing protein [Catenuloplanes nepalensis]MDP9799743.1 CO/xanthine dehydrogenase FAD-binding subunit [Catenuloplanes nepalensis]